MGEYVNPEGSQNHISRKYENKPGNLQTNTALLPPENPSPAKDEERGSTKNITCYAGSQIPATKPGYEYNGHQIVYDGSGNGCGLHLEKSKHPHYFKTALVP